MIHPIVSSILMYYKYYPMIYLFVCAYHAYNYYEYSKVIAHYIKIVAGKRDPPEPKEEDYEWIFIEEDILDDDDVYFDLNMVIMVSEPEPKYTHTIGNGTIIEGEPEHDYNFVEIPL